MSERLITIDANLAGGETLAGRVSHQAAKVLRYCGGFDCRTGLAVPDKLPTLVGGNACAPTQQIPIVYSTQDGTRRVIYWDETGKFQLVNTATGAVTSITPATAFVGLADSRPVRVDSLLLYPTTDGIVTLEPDAPSTQVRLMSLKAPTDYLSSAAAWPVSHQPVTPWGLFGIGDSYTSFVMVVDSNTSDSQVVLPAENSGYTGYNCLQFNPTVTADVGGHAGAAAGVDQYFTLDLSAYNSGAGATLTGSTYLVLDLILEYAGQDPSLLVTSSGGFFNSEQTTAESGFVIGLYSDAPDGSTKKAATLLRQYKIPQFRKTGGPVNRMCIHLGGLDDAVKTLAIGTSDGFVPPQFADDEVDDSQAYYLLWVQANAYPSPFSWEADGNFLVPEATFVDSPWFDLLPPDPGDHSTTQATSATVLETFSESDKGEATASPGRPLLQYAYCFQAWDQLSTVENYRVQVSNPSRFSETLHADPWSTYQVGLPVPQDSNGKCIWDDYGAYLKHFLVYRRRAVGTGEIGDVVWGAWEFRGSVRVDSSNTQGAACTLDTGTNHIVTTGTAPAAGNAVSFETSLGGLVAGKVYYVVAANPVEGGWMQVSENYNGTALTLTANGANTWSLAYVFHDTRLKDMACTFTASTGKVTYTDGTVNVAFYDFLLNPGDTVSFGSSLGNLRKGVTYYVIEAAANGWVGGDGKRYGYFKVSDKPGGAAIALTDGSGTFSTEAPSSQITTDVTDVTDTVPLVMEEDQDFAEAARYIAVAEAEQRLYSAGQGYDTTTSAWKRPLTMGVSNQGDYGAMPTTAATDSNGDPLVQDGMQLGNYASTSLEARGLATRRESKFLFTDQAPYEIVGQDPRTGWRPVRVGEIGSASAATEAVTPESILWLGSQSQGIEELTPGGQTSVSDGVFDASLFDLTQAHGAEAVGRQYVFFGWHADPTRAPNSKNVSCTTIADTDGSFPSTVSAVAHGLSRFQRVTFAQTAGGVVVGTTYFVSEIVDDDHFRVADSYQEAVDNAYRQFGETSGVNHFSTVLWCLAIFDLRTRAWRRRYSQSYQLVGMCAADDGSLYGVRPDGRVVDLFGGTTDHGGDQCYELITQPMQTAPPLTEGTLSSVVLGALASEQGTLHVSVEAFGRVNTTQGPAQVTVSSAGTNYSLSGKDLPLGREVKSCDAASCALLYQGEDPPTIVAFGVVAEGGA